MLFIASVFDVKSQKGDVPEIFLIAGIFAGLFFHLLHSIHTWSLQPILWSLGTGIAFTAYGYFAYIRGMWGGADMLGISVLGFATPYMLGAIGLMDLLVNTMMTGFVYALGFGLINGLRSSKVRDDFYSRLKNSKVQLSGLLLLGLAFAVYSTINGVRGEVFLSLYLFMILVYYFMESVEDELMVREVDASEVEVGDVLAEGEIKGVTEDELEELEGTVKLKKGIRFMPVFPIALVLTVAGLSFLQILVTML